jgi:acetyl esterase/lipase
MAAAVGSYGVTRFGGASLPTPSTVVMAYTAHADLAAEEPPTFAVGGEQDDISPPSIMRQRVSALRRIGTKVEYREYLGVGHGFWA